MSDADPGTVTVSEDGVTVHKYVDTEEFEALAVVFEFEFDDDAAVTIDLSDPIPDGIPAEDVGIHPEYGGEYWTITEETVNFERHFTDEASYTTLYGVRTDKDDVDQFAVEPTLSVTKEAEPAATAEEAGDILDDEPADVDAAEDILGDSDKYGSVESSDIVREVISGERENVPGVDAEADTAETADDDPAVEPAEPADSSMDPLAGNDMDDEAAASDATSADDDSLADVDVADAQPDQASSEGSEPADETPADALAADAESIATGPEESDEPTPSDSATPTDMTEDDSMDDTPTTEDEMPPAATAADGADDDDDSDVDDVAEEREMITVPATGGVARLLVKELQEGHVDEKWRRQLRDALGVTGSEATDSGAMDARIQHLQNEVSDLTAYTDALEEFLNENGVGRDLINSIEDDLDTLQSSVDQLETRMDTDEDELTGLEESVSAIESDIDDLRDELAAQDELRDRIEELSADVAAMNDDIEEIMEFHERMSAVFNQQTPDE